MRFRRFEVVEGVKDEARVREEAAMKSQERGCPGDVGTTQGSDHRPPHSSWNKVRAPLRFRPCYALL